MEKPVVLLADDNEATCTLIVALLRNEFAVDIARDGAEALEKLQTRRYSVVLLDLLMPVLDGYAVLDYLTREKREMLERVLVVTAAVSTREMERINRYAVWRVIAKPFEVAVLQSLVRQCADLAASRD